MKKYIEIKLVESEIPLNNKHYIEVQNNDALASGVSIGQDMVDNFIKEIHTSKVGDKTTMTRVVLVNGYEMIETSGCVDPNNYNEEIGTQVCLSKIKDKIWSHLGFLLQTAWKGAEK